MQTSNKISISQCKKLLRAEGLFGKGKIYFEDRYLGPFVTHGHSSGNGKTVYASRITKPFRIRAEASNRTALLNKIAAELAKGAKERNLSLEDLSTPEHTGESS